MFRLITHLTVMFLLASLGARTTRADLATVNFSGTIDQLFDNDNLLAGSVSAPSVFSGTFTYDDQTPDGNNGNSAIGVYSYISFVLQIDSMLIDSTNVVGSGDKKINLFDEAGSPQDVYNTNFANTGARTFEFNDLLFNQGFLTLVSSDLTTLTDDSLIAPPSLSQFDGARVFRLGGTDLATNTSSFVVIGTVTQIAEIPEPSTFLLLWLGMSTLFGSRLFYRRRRSQTTG